MQADEESGLVEKPKRSSKILCFMAFCKFLSVTVGICSALCGIANGMALVVGPHFFQSVKSCIEQSLRLYGTLFSLIIILVETEWRLVLLNLALFENWIVKGIFQIFVAILTTALVESNGDSDYEKSLRLYRDVAGFSLFFCGCFYFLGGILCFGSLKRAQAQRMIERGRVESALQMLERQQAELKKTLAKYPTE